MPRILTFTYLGYTGSIEQVCGSPDFSDALVAWANIGNIPVNALTGPLRNKVDQVIAKETIR